MKGKLREGKPKIKKEETEISTNKNGMYKEERTKKIVKARLIINEGKKINAGGGRRNE